ncbi:MAG TPA: hypothetical protein VML75_23385 [Kofleriaceae bacterium]|nr:hypothetical protein [Kofleriaceae bacterium]
MPRMKLRACGMGIAAALGLLASAAAAGPLSKVVHGLETKSGQGRPAPERETRGGNEPRDAAAPPPVTDHGYVRPYHGGGPVVVMYGYPYPTAADDTELRLYAGLHSVRDSNGAGALEARVTHDGFGVEIGAIRYYEEIIRDNQMTNLTMDVWNLGFAYRAAVMGDRDQTALWVRAGLAGTSANDMFLLGASGGLELAHNLSDSMGVSASGRYYAMQDQIRAVELKAAVALSVFRAGYRLLDFDVGPPLRGPELGIELSF